MEQQANYIRRIEIHGLWERFNIGWDLRPDVNILSGINGVGKTTILNRSVGYLEELSGEMKSDEKNGVRLFFDNPQATYIPYDVILRHDNSIGVTDPIYPVYIDSNVMCGRAGVLENGRWSNVVYLPCLSENNFIPAIPDRRIDILYLCYPNNPTGTVISKAELKKWVNYALENDTLILYDAAYEAYIQDPDIPHSIYEIKGAKKVAIEFRSFSKTAGFTGVRCGYTVVPKELTAATLEGKRIPLNRLWNRRQCTKFNGTSYITQRGAEAIYSPEGKEQIKATIHYYMTNARIMKEGLESTGLKVFGGENAPYLWVKAPRGISSWKFFEQMLYEANVVGTPGVGFGPSGEGYIRLTAFGERADCEEAMKRIRRWIL